MTDHRHMDLADYIAELTQAHTHTEHYVTRVGLEWQPRDHHVRVPALLTQLANNDTPSAAAEDGPRPGFQSKPAARLDALAALADIDLEVNRWIVDIGDQPAHLDTARALQQLHGLVASADPVTRRAVLKDVRRWWTRARVVTGWDSPAWTPDATCPQCGERGTLRVRLADHIAMCTYRGDDHARREACGALWDESTIGVLADHIRLESSADRVAQPAAGPCWCPVPEPAVPDLRFQCRRCGSARCWNAVQARLVATVRHSVAS
ncbi:MAG: hypothetical protein HOV66_07610 [Streptomycetaceae bacterium]|nr:hypothetical protein [Streptomycetaceae bacterium]